MDVLVVGVGVIGSYTTHALCAAGNDVTVVARGAWAETLRSKGLVIRHYVQRRTTTDHPRVVEGIPRAHFDVAFSVMRQDQQLAAVSQLAGIDADLLVLVGNDMRGEEVAAKLAKEGFAGRVLFGFQSTAGNREGDHAVCVRWGATGLDVGPLHGTPSQADVELLGQVFARGAYKPRWTHDFDDWLLTHGAAVVPMALASYACGCDLHTASSELLHRMVSAQAETYGLLERLGHQILPKSDQTLFDGGIHERTWYLFVWMLAHTAIGTLCIDDHCRHAPDEMHTLMDCIEGLRAQAGDPPMPAWDALVQDADSW